MAQDAAGFLELPGHMMLWPGYGSSVMRMKPAQDQFMAAGAAGAPLRNMRVFPGLRSSELRRSAKAIHTVFTH